MKNEIALLMADICADYANYDRRTDRTDTQSDRRKEMIAEFEAGIGHTVGKKYIKITKENGGSVWGFVVACDDDKKFAKGTILKAAGWKTPARNFSRGNILEGGYTVRWTGC
tara:strand:- start:191 stop:526 length:336 start_codon:yes stop_codon:yes gene_type:complete